MLSPISPHLSQHLSQNLSEKQPVLKWYEKKIPDPQMVETTRVMVVKNGGWMVI